MEITAVLTLQRDGLQCGLVPVAKAVTQSAEGKVPNLFWVMNLLESDENTPERNVHRPRILCTLLGGWGQQFNNSSNSFVRPPPLATTPCRWKVLWPELNFDFMQIYHLVSGEFQIIPLRKRFCPSQDWRATETTISDQVCLTLQSKFPSCLPVPAPSTAQPTPLRGVRVPTGPVWSWGCKVV